MDDMTFEKILSENDVGETGSHQAGMHVPKGTNREFIDFLPFLDPEKYNPDCFLTCCDENGFNWQFRYVFYNNKLHGQGTRNEYRLTHMTKYLRNAKKGDVISLKGQPKSGVFKVAIRKVAPQMARPITVQLRGWERKY